MGANHTVLRWGNPYTNFVGYVNGSDWTPTGFGVFWPVILELAHRYGLHNAIGGEGFAPARFTASSPLAIPFRSGFRRDSPAFRSAPGPHGMAPRSPIPTPNIP
jgi:hypothetical protein